MLTLPFELTTLIVAFAPLFSKTVFKHLQVLIGGAILAPGKRTVTSALRVMGLSADEHFQNYHRVLNRAVWSSLAASRILLSLLVAAFAPTGVLVMGIDDTIERRRGDQIKAKGIYRDPVRSSRSHLVKASGLRWLSLMLLVDIAWAGRVWALPFLTVLCPSQRYYQERGRTHRKLTERARQMLLLVKRWLPQREIVVVADSSFAAIELLDAVREAVTLVTRLRLDAALYTPAPDRQPGLRGRPRKKGARLPTLKAVLASAQTVWQSVNVAGWYGEAERTVEITSDTCVWYHTGMPAVPVRWALVRDPQEKFDAQAFLCTNVETEAAQILAWFVRRWTIEVTFEEARAHLGIETQRQWSEKAIARTTPALFALYSIITLLAARLVESNKLPVRRAAWYAKQSATFSDTIAYVRRWLWSHHHFQMSQTTSDMIKVPRSLLERLTDTLCYAA
ncbi:MAG: transposase [Acidobacteriota bacterium]|nr:transposase [Acidobacteriota bacterium]